MYYGEKRKEKEKTKQNAHSKDPNIKKVQKTNNNNKKTIY